MKWNEGLVALYRCKAVTLASGTEVLFNSCAMGRRENWYLKKIVAMKDMPQQEPFLTGLDRASLVGILNGAGAVLGVRGVVR